MYMYTLYEGRRLTNQNSQKYMAYLKLEGDHFVIQLNMFETKTRSTYRKQVFLITDIGYQNLRIF